MKTITLKDGTTYHCPYADRVPPMTQEDRDHLREDIRRRGVQVPVVVDERNNVIDGHNRLEIAAELELDEVPLDRREGLTDDQKRALAADLNLHRRHLDREDKRKLLERRLRENPDQSDRAIAAAVHVDHKTVGAARAELESSGEIPQMTTRLDAKHTRRPARPRAQPSVPTASTDATGPLVSNVADDSAQQLATTASAANASVVAAAPDETEPKQQAHQPADSRKEQEALRDFSSTLRSQTARVVQINRRLKNGKLTKRERDAVAEVIRRVEGEIRRVKLAFWPTAANQSAPGSSQTSTNLSEAQGGAA